MREPDVRDEAAPEERADAPPRPIDELVGNDDVERLVFFFQAADRARREDVFDAQHLHPEDVGAEIQLRRRQPVSGAVPRKKRHALSAQRAEHVRTRRIAKRRRQRDLVAIGDVGHVVQAAAADDADLNGIQSVSCLRLRGSSSLRMLPLRANAV